MNKQANKIRAMRIGMIVSWAAATILVGALPAAGLTRIRDITRLLGERTNMLIGHGLVVGLNGTGDGDSLVTTRPLAELLNKLGNAIDLSELKPKNVAYVSVSAELSRNGMREGDKINVIVNSINAAKSLAGGYLLLSPLSGSNHVDDRIYAIAQGPISIPNAEFPASGIVIGGANIEENIFHLYVDYEMHPGQAVFTLVLDDDHANFATAKTIADTINYEMSLSELNPGMTEGMVSGFTNDQAAIALGPKNIQVIIPAKQALNPTPFIARITSLPVELPDPEASVVINMKNKMIVYTDDIEISPVGVTVGGMEIQIGQTPAPGGPPAATQQPAANNVGRAKLRELIFAMNQLNISGEDQISVIYAIHKLGALRANIRTMH